MANLVFLPQIDTDVSQINRIGSPQTKELGEFTQRRCRL